MTTFNFTEWFTRNKTAIIVGVVTLVAAILYFKNKKGGKFLK